ncbi:Cytochrome P450 [Canna indica]|uniref:Cytochrome P450 n=1 Tax=Canna indica TaxID=4628 RepID=A0AAQ3JPT3_9LILI|nr:Cytochrome P450 [Canna indica]
MAITSLLNLPSLCFIAGVFTILCFHAVANKGHQKRRLPPGPLAVPVLGNFLWFLWRRLTSGKPKHLIRDLHAVYGPIITIHVGSIPVIFVCDRALAHKALVELGSTFAGRFPSHPAIRFFEGDQYRIASATYGSVWRRLRSNLVSEILHPSRIRLHEQGRSWTLDLLLRRLQPSDSPIVARESFRFAMYALFLLMCFGERLEEEVIEEIKETQRRILLLSSKLTVFVIMPSITRYIFWRRRKAAMELQRKKTELLVPLIRARRERRKELQSSYVDSLLDLDLEAEGGRKLGEDDIVALCAEFLMAGTGTTVAALEWIMANLVKHQHIQTKLVKEIESVLLAGDKPQEDITEEDLPKMPYLKAVVMEGLRRHPPAGNLLPHTATTEDAVLSGYSMPKEVPICFAAAGSSWEGEVWEDPMEFRPERFMEGGEGEGVDITGSKEMKMMPFGAGRRICPGMGMAMLHLQYFVANLAWKLEWTAGVGEEVNLSEKEEFAVVMKNPLRVSVVPRLRRN